MQRIAGLSGSLRERSYNSALLRTARDMAPQGMDIDILSIDGLPAFNADLEQDGYPVGVQRLRDRIDACQGVLVATPEYNHGVPGVLKNAIDWLSRGKDAPLKGKPLAIIGASTGKVGTARAQMQLREMGLYLSMPVLPGIEVAVGPAKDAFDDDLRLTDDTTRDLLHRLLAAFGQWLPLHVPAAERKDQPEGTAE